MSQESFSKSTLLKDVKFGLMGCVPLEKKQFSTWRIQQQQRLIIWSDEVEKSCLPLPITEFEVVENFLLGKMMFVGGGENKNWNRPVRGKYTPGIPVSFDFLPDQKEKAKIQLNWSVLFTYYKRYEVLVVFLYSTISEISVDQMIFLRNLNWYPEDSGNLWKMECSNNGTRLGSVQALFNQVLINSRLKDKRNIATRLGSVRALFNQVLTNSRLKDKRNIATRLGSVQALFNQVLTIFRLKYKEIDNDCPVFSFMELQTVGPSSEVLSFPKNPQQLTAAEHYGLSSGDEGYRLVNLNLAPGNSGNRPGDALVSFNPELTFSGRTHFAYQFSPTSCLGFMSENVAIEKGNWEEWYSNNVCNVPILLRYIRLTTAVSCLSDGIPVLVEICMLRYTALVKVEKEIRNAAKRLPLTKAYFRLNGNTPLDEATRQVEELDLYQDSALWVIGGTYTDSLFNYSAIRARIDRAKGSLQISESESIRTAIAFSGIVIAIAIAAVGYIFNSDQDIKNRKSGPPTALSNSHESSVRATPVSVALPVAASLPAHLPVTTTAPETMRRGR